MTSFLAWRYIILPRQGSEMCDLYRVWETTRGTASFGGDS